ncbi:MAG: prepilin-type N-terminal cleavage/methylation domain-containing protein [Prosthecobacter sp.]|jgi:prepilin-type N-terminal cleavage/methylation domain-containing protein|uniref:prepilin-type N-terminal cleavage/methylation domain-containing protein n=1 Tax=Prosthecobacter sp. TaxID=1965333 RepID=UPI001A0B6AF3|nr:prepilin-type N-terminal cleavage/methylation domain-containing protein [Prosthecobacter sp.]MBE2286737.1 prepilin-type N-terminal cleavage/methylation domain-containing protein [Prosthecobacter sp.]
MKATLHRPFIPRSGLTLLELLVVLSILAVLSTVALTSSSGIADQARYEATQRTLENIRDAVLGPDNLRDNDGTLLYTGFVADTGRLPRAVAEVVDGGTVLTLAELVEQPAGMAAYDVIPAITSNCTPSAEADDLDLDLSSDTVRLGVGWRGPYLRLTPGNLLPRDGWGAQLVTPVGVVPGFPNNCLLNGILPVAAGDPIDQIVSYGRDGVPGGADAYDADLEVNPVNFSELVEATVLPQVEIQNSAGTVLNSSDITRVFVRLFEPNTSTGTIAAKAAVGPVGAMGDPFDSYHEHNSDLLTFSPVSTTPGIRVIRAYALKNADPTRPTTAGVLKSAPVYLKVRPDSPNTITLVIINNP